MPRKGSRKEKSLGSSKENDHFSSTEEHNDLFQQIESYILEADPSGLTLKELIEKCDTTRGKVGETLGRLKAKGKIRKDDGTGRYVSSC